MLYLLRGDEPLLIEEAVTHILNKEKNMHKKIIEIQDVKSLQAALLDVKCGDLFSQKPVVILKMTDKVYKLLQKRLPVDIKVITLSSVTLKQFPQWMMQRFMQAGFTLNVAVKELLCTYLEGNLLAVKQCVEKLKLLYPQGIQLTEENVLEVLTPAARYSVFDLMNAMAVAALPKVSLILQHLFTEGVEPALILWGLARECRKQKCQKALSQLVEADEIIKGIRAGNVLEALERAAFSIAGKNIL